ncbi:DNA-directed RNA polymerase II subunit 2-like isoform X2 [Asparagus officinalis]|uniref:DNA-directed RNA polymerase II subunit 2-like isoform X2 n=1 Tax=Asparagus officinalis TaxID=4686 RepID=UPI00098E7EBB|nr:DNA-directed RNA polymerase II subunit 2-like isoform X2 [Asparagus officinalis]
MVYITVGSAAHLILEFLEEWSTENFEEISPAVIPQATKIFVNGCWVGVHRNPELLVKTLRQLRRQFFSEISMGILRVFSEIALHLLYKANDAQLSIMVAEQVEQAHAAIVALTSSQKTVNQIRENFVPIESLSDHKTMAKQ